MTDRENICAIEAILFASGGSVSIDKIMSALDIKTIKFNQTERTDNNAG